MKTKQKKRTGGEGPWYNLGSNRISDLNSENAEEFKKNLNQIISRFSNIFG